MNTSIILATVLCLLCMILTEWVHDNLARHSSCHLRVRERWWHPDAPWPLVFLLRSAAAAQGQVQKSTETVLFWWQRIGHPAVTSIAVKLAWVSPRDCSSCAQVYLWLGAPACNLSTANYDREAVLSVFILQTARRPGTRFQGIFVTHPISKINTKSLQFVNLKWTHALAAPVSPLGPHLRRLLPSVRTPQLPASPVGANIWEGVTERKSSGLYGTSLFAIATVPDNVARIYRQTNRTCYRFSWPVWIEYPN